MNDGVPAGASVYVASTSPVRTLTTRALPAEPPDTNSRPCFSLSPTDGVPGPSLITSPSPLRRSSA